MKVLIADRLSPETVTSLQELGIEVANHPEFSADDLPQHARDANVIVVRSTKVTTATIEAAEGLSLIVRAGAGVNTIDVATASACGVYVANCPGKNADAVAELAIGLLIAADRRIAFAWKDLQQGDWKKKAYGASRGLKGRTLGIMGLGAIGERVAQRAQGLQMNVLAWSRSLTPERAQAMGFQYAESPLDVARNSDAVSLHTAYNPELKHFIGAEFFSAMRDGAIFVNTARGELVDTAALKAAISEKQLRVGLDAYENEPTGADGPNFVDTDLVSMVTGTPHIGASTDQASEAIAAEVVRIIRVFRESGRPPGAVNLCQRSPATHALVVRHLNRVGVLAGVLDHLRAADVNVEEMENTIFDGASAACCTLLLDQAPSDQALSKIRESKSVLQVTLNER
ncbi:MAG: 3-phosphoglycerate dehydrogenase family protein [Pirellulales bacterium]|nr:3-phosphoglycerate dehydrogenase family protein [Pirellulales bacterium]